MFDENLKKKKDNDCGASYQIKEKQLHALLNETIIDVQNITAYQQEDII